MGTLFYYLKINIFNLIGFYGFASIRPFYQGHGPTSNDNKLQAI